MKAIEQVILLENAVQNLGLHSKDENMLQNIIDTLKDQLEDDADLRKFLALGKR